jgi:hypothetical protein
MLIQVPESVGVLIDKITILQIKNEYLSELEQLKNIQYELGLLEQLRSKRGITGPVLEEMMASLKTINLALWAVEDQIRDCERLRDFGDQFIGLARSIYKLNDQRAAVKRSINELYGSAINEEKSYAAY